MGVVLTKLTTLNNVCAEDCPEMDLQLSSGPVTIPSDSDKKSMPIGSVCKGIVNALFSSIGFWFKKAMIAWS